MRKAGKQEKIPDLLGFLIDPSAKPMDCKPMDCHPWAWFVFCGLPYCPCASVCPRRAGVRMKPPPCGGGYLEARCCLEQQQFQGEQFEGDDRCDDSSNDERPSAVEHRGDSCPAGQWDEAELRFAGGRAVVGFVAAACLVLHDGDDEVGVEGRQAHEPAEVDESWSLIGCED